MNMVLFHKGFGSTLILGLYMQDLSFSDRCSWGFTSSGMWHTVVGWVAPYVLSKRREPTHPITWRHIPAHPSPHYYVC